MFDKYGFKKIDFRVGEPQTVVVGMSGGVDSSVAAAILKWQGYNVIGLFMKNWEETGADGMCTTESDYSDVKRVSEVLNIPYYTVNFSRQYMDNVFKIFLDGLGRGYTPNPDILCNREIKFGPFLDFAKKLGADYIATGHYVRVVRDGSNACLLKGIDDNKDQSYFLCGLSQEQISKALFPVGDLDKTQVREIAERLNLITAKKKDSTGICFIGERKFRDFMKNYLGNKNGEIRTLSECIVGSHEGLMYYTLGQRKGLKIGGVKGEDEARWFVVKKDLEKNVLYVNNGECDEMFTKELIAIDFNWIGGVPLELKEKNIDKAKFECMAKTRYRQPDQRCWVEILDNKDSKKDFSKIKVVFDKKQRAVTPGQWVVLYNGDVCLGGGVISV